MTHRDTFYAYLWSLDRGADRLLLLDGVGFWDGRETALNGPHTYEGELEDIEEASLVAAREWMLGI